MRQNVRGQILPEKHYRALTHGTCFVKINSSQQADFKIISKIDLVKCVKEIMGSGNVIHYDA